MGALTGADPSSSAAPGAPSPDRGTFGAGAIVFVGFMGAGKSTAARAVARALGTQAVDSDADIERELGESIESFFEREGEDAFRAREEERVLGLLAREDVRVVALGGGALGSARVREALSDHLVVWLEVESDDAWRRAAGRGRPLARDRERFEALHAERAATYLAAADVIVPAAVDRRSMAAALLPALNRFRERRATGGSEGLRLAWASAASGDYPVYVGRGLLAGGVFDPPDGRQFVVADERVAELHELPGDWIEGVPGGESDKTLAQAELVLRAMARGGVARDDVVVAFGGGVVGDLAGFCAAVYQRGVRCVQVPTTLVAQVDSAYGGKTGVDLPEAKNYVGAYHQPSSVLVDPDVLATLPREEVAAGYAEVVKTALIAGGPLWESVRAGGEPTDEDTILGCLRTKLATVAADERDAGRRQVLNLGHTVGHALEAATGYAQLRHGEAVALGLLAALRLSGQGELRDEVADLLSARGLPSHASGVSVDEVVALVGRDKKRRGGVVPFVLVEAPGSVSHGHAVGEDALRSAVAEVIEP